MNPPRGGAPGGSVMSSTAEGAQYAAVLTLTLNPSGSWHPANVRSQPLSSPCNSSTTKRGGRRQRGPLKLPALAATSQEPHSRTSRARLRYAAHKTKCQTVILVVWHVGFCLFRLPCFTGSGRWCMTKMWISSYTVLICRLMSFFACLPNLMMEVQMWTLKMHHNCVLCTPNHALT